MSKRIYLVTQGHYSSYRILAAYSTRKVAKQAADLWNRSVGDTYAPAEVEAHPLYDDLTGAVVEQFPNGGTYLHLDGRGSGPSWGDRMKPDFDAEAFLKAQREGLV